MNPIKDKLAGPLNKDVINELVLEAAAIIITAKKIAIEASPENASIAIWDETIEAVGHRMEIKPAESAKYISERQVEAGNDEADIEHRLSTVINKRSKE